ncbi:hypothetical protein ASPBRDRAFT_30562 [Aspergillus brasiliensis CBS 101740]|uniref:Amine oxidase domain-containing protein n=1 Tax=Aspergillus brasiliensis (strain CBS 101740 / IMI 381727 / IBT 21946) TaxID=767769 RepID=A0A1L9UKQ9_ASPBC|nr:hypothetical protein ASPBRDRAFT_30562 [Aspergillus brasiliensis CBS 101740]
MPNLSSRILILLLVLGTCFAIASPNTIQSCSECEVIRRDVCIIGGGAAGTYAAVNLLQEGYSVVVIEKKGRLGGHTNTYIDPSTNTPLDFGVTLFEDSPETRDFFSYLGVPFAKSVNSGGELQRIDFATGEVVDPYPGNVSDALERYGDILRQYPYLLEGWDLPEDVPEDLLMPFGDFVDKYDLGPAVELISIYSQGVRNWLNYPTVYLMKFVSLDMLRALQTGFLSTARHHNSELYEAALEVLGNDVLLDSVVVDASREHDEMHQLRVESTDGTSWLIEANTTILAAPPSGQVLNGPDLDNLESSLFSQFIHGHYYAGLVRVDGCPEGVQIVNRGSDTPYSLPLLPCTLMMYPTAVPGIVTVGYGSEEPMTEEQVKAAIVEDILGLRRAGYDVGDPEFLAFADHSPFEMSVGRKAIEDGFYANLNKLQGYRNTYYVGATFEYPGSSAIWRAVDRLLPLIVDNIGRAQNMNL